MRLKTSRFTLWTALFGAVACTAALAACGGGSAVSPSAAGTGTATATPSASPAPQNVARTPGPVVSHVFSPTVTDPNITTDTLADRSYAPTYPDNSTLLVWLPGQSAAPGAYTIINAFAASVGFHVISVDYPNANAASTYCLLDMTCYGNVWWAKWDGRTGPEGITPSNAIQNRLVKMLAYLAAMYPSENWSQFATATSWSGVVFAGHSLGAMEAAAIAKVVPVKRVVLFAGPEDGVTQVNGSVNVPNYLSQAGPTPVSVQYLFYHLQDTAFADSIVANATALGLDAYGPYTSVDGVVAPFGNSHELTTNVASANPHHAVAFDDSIQLDANGNPIYAAAWTYLFGP